jgi:integrase
VTSFLGAILDRHRSALDRCAGCRKGRADIAAGASHDFRQDNSLPVWHGWHAFRRGLATNLHELGVDDLTIQRICRHDDVATTQRHYVKTRDAGRKAAMQKLEKAIARSK